MYLSQDDIVKFVSEPATTATTAATMEVATTTVMMVETTVMMTPSDYIRCVVKLVVTPSRISSLRSTNVSKPWNR
jgi:hypothetical protein